ncbi:hypothetical protein J3R82DRAFT_5107 [Butyriboletus roseoflavus]|nr:hypothetical protein J3R82DRAFT_5107 [Butyriboletus roseoflavus]
MISSWHVLSSQVRPLPATKFFHELTFKNLLMIRARQVNYNREGRSSANTKTTDASFILKHTCDCLRVSHDDFAMVISSVRCIMGMPFSASCKIDLVMLQKLADSTESLASGHSAELPKFISPTSKVDVLAGEITAEISKAVQFF